MKLLKGKVALVTGAAQGIGKAIAEAFAEHGAHVVIGDINFQGAQETSQAINRAGGPKAIPVRLDVRDPVQVQAAVDLAVQEFGRLDILVNNAAILRAYPIVDFPLEEWREVFRVNMEGAFLCAQAAARQMIQQGDGGCIINIASASARKADAKHAAYSSAKAALVCFTRILALELGPYGIRANAICPGATMTEMLQGVFEQVPGIKEDLIAKTVLGKLGEPRDQANAAVFLASDMASHITGEHLIVSGGEFMDP
ncbi:MAG: SDR family oxidoreductase [Anaerolineae bacterium]|nr:SDR family oxidoreductase [Anaerolineae bacterium]